LQQFNLNKMLLLHVQELTFAFCFCSEKFYEVNILSCFPTSCKIIVKCIPASILPENKNTWEMDHFWCTFNQWSLCLMFWQFLDSYCGFYQMLTNIISKVDNQLC
jgi:hypothetical protein